MRQYYYTVASLPAIRSEEAPFLTQDEFLEDCDIEVDADDRRYIRTARIWGADEEEHADTGVSLMWNTHLQEIQRHAAVIRAQNLGRDAERLPRVDMQDATLPERLRQILNEDTPLKTENALLRLLWQHAESLETGHHFDREKLFVYHLKLQIAARRTRLNDSESGADEFDRQYEVVAQSLMEIAT